MSKVKAKNEVLKNYYKRLEAKQIVDTIFNGTLYSVENMRKWLDNFNEDRRRGKLK